MYLLIKIHYFIFLFSLQLGCQLVASQGPFLYPKSIIVLEREGYTIAYEGRTRNALWVYERLTSHSFSEKIVNRKAMRFQEDRDIPEPIRATLQDYRKSGFDKGHLCPFADCCSSDVAARETFLLSNISPQIHQFNAGCWNQLEQTLRKMVPRYKALHIFTLPLYLPLNGTVQYSTLGNNHVAVPTHFCKLVFAEKQTGELDKLAYILPNASIPEDVSLESFRTTLERVERLSGVMFE
jgi:endonuclease G